MLAEVTGVLKVAVPSVLRAVGGWQNVPLQKDREKMKIQIQGRRALTKLKP